MIQRFFVLILLLSGASAPGCAMQVSNDGPTDDDARARDDASSSEASRDDATPVVITEDSGRTLDSSPTLDAPHADDASESDVGLDTSTPDDASTGDPCPDWRCTTGCADIVPFPGSFDASSAEAIASGYYIGTEKRYAFLRRHIVLVVQYAACEVKRRFSGTAPLALQDMSQADGKTPGTDVGSPRHPTTTHTGSDIDISYYQTDGANDVQIICGDGSDTNANGVAGRYNDGYFCTTNKNIVDWGREVWFFAKLAETPRARVFGIDQTLPDHFTTGADELRTKGDVDAATFARMTTLGYGAAGGWQFHHHHSHMSYLLPK